jgi:hypothetical protein
MLLEFKTCQLKKGTKNYKQLIENIKLTNEFVVVGEENIKDYADCYKVLNAPENMSLISALTLDEQAMRIPKDELELKKDDLPGYETQEIDISKEYLTLDIVENIQRLNA